MRNFIKRQFRNINTQEIITLGGTGFEKQHQSNIAVILGEPASGKTYQLKEYAKSNLNAQFVELITLKDTDTINENIDVLLIDSIDEALTQNNQKELARKLKEYMKICISVNPKVRFVLSSRFLEWNEYFKGELKEIDEQLREYKILPISREEINELLKNQGINEQEFWSFIDNNYLKDLLKNILIILEIIEYFEDYKARDISFVELYEDISKRYIIKQGDDRINDDEVLIERKLLVSASIAIYMLLNRHEYLNKNDIAMLASEVYIFDDTKIAPKDLNIVLNSALFEKTGDKFKFFHKSIQEFLMAYFIDKIDLELEKIKKLFASKLRFYEEFEEVLIYLTNLKPELFDSFVEFDPFIFRRHPLLSKEQQEKLLLAVIDKFKSKSTQHWGRWHAFDDITIVKFDKLDNLVEILRANLKAEDADFYLMQLLKFNYSKELQDLVFEFFEQRLSDKKSLKELIKDNFVDIYEFNVQLYDFLLKHQLLEKDEHRPFMSFEAELFSSLYGIKYKYGEERELHRTDYDFKKLISLLEYFPLNSFKYIVPFLTGEDSKLWFEYIKSGSKVTRDNYIYNAWIIYALLNKYESKQILVDIRNFLRDEKIYLHKNKDIKIDISKFADDFWDIYFNWDYEEHIFELLDIKKEDIEAVLEKYNICDYLEKYIRFRLIEGVDEILMIYPCFKKHMEKIWRKQKEDEKRREEEFKRDYPEIANREENEQNFLNDCISRLNTDEEKEFDLYNIFLYAFDKHSDNSKEMDSYLKDILKEKYPCFINQIKSIFRNDELFLEIKKDLLSSSINETLMIRYLFNIASIDETRELIKNKSDYEKLFWHMYKGSLNSFDNFFVELTKSYYEEFKLFSFEALELSIEQANDDKIPDSLKLLFDMYKNLDKYNSQELSKFIDYIKKHKEIFTNINEISYEKSQLLEVVLLDKNNYEYILDLMKNELENLSFYLVFLLKIDKQRAINNFYTIYNQVKRYKSLWERIKIKFSKEKYDGYDNLKINPKKIKLFQQFINSIKKSNQTIENLSSENIENILNDYCEFFKKYETPEGSYIVDIYDDMHRIKDNIWNYLENTDKHIELLEKLRNSENNEISTHSEYTLTRAYEQQEKNKNYQNSYYKEILEENITMGKTQIQINGDGNNVAINSKGVKQESNIKFIDDDTKKWYQKWWFVSIIGGLVVGVVIYIWLGKLLLSLGVAIVAFLTIIFFNPKRRFFRVGLLLLAIGGSTFLPIVNKLIGKYLGINLDPNPWIGGLMVIVALGLFILDHFENKNG